MNLFPMFRSLLAGSMLLRSFLRRTFLDFQLVSRLWRVTKTKNIVANRKRTYQDSHFSSRDIPGASRSELDADCRRFLALYTRHTFAFATRGPSGPGPQVVYPHVTPLCSATTTTVPPSERPPLPFGTNVSFPLLTLAATCASSLSFLQLTGFVLFLFPRVLALGTSYFFFFTYLCRYLDCASVLYFLWGATDIPIVRRDVP